MTHFTCDLCGRELRGGEDRYVVKIEVYAQYDPVQLTEADLEEDHMEAISQLLRELDDDPAALVKALEPVHNHLRYDLCSSCRRRYVRDPLCKELNKEVAQKFDFSEN